MSCQSRVPVNTLADYKEIVQPGRQNLPANFNVFAALRPCNATGLHPHHAHSHAIPTHFNPHPYPVMPSRHAVPTHFNPQPYPVMPHPVMPTHHAVPTHLMPTHHLMPLPKRSCGGF